MAKSTEASFESTEPIASSLLVRVLGTSADAVDEALRRFTAYQLRNVERILQRADAKSRSAEESSSVSLRVAHVLLEDGSYCDDELMADYLGGLLLAAGLLRDAMTAPSL